MTGGKHSQFGILKTDVPYALTKLRALHQSVALREFMFMGLADDWIPSIRTLSTSSST